MTVSWQTHPPEHDEPGTQAPIWDRFFTIAPLVLTGTIEANGGDRLAHAGQTLHDIVVKIA